MHASRIENPTQPHADGQAPDPWAAVRLIAMYFLLQIAAATTFTVVISVTTANPAATLERPAMQALLVIFSMVVATPLTLLLARRKWPRSWAMASPPGFGFVRPRNLWFLALAVVAGLAAPLLGGFLTQWLAQGHTVTQDIRQLGGNTPPGWRIPLVLLVVGVGPLTEELLFRGVLLSALLKRCSVGWAVAISSLAFALVHLPGLQFQWYALPALLLLALTLAWLRLHSASIWPAILAHATNNLLAVAVWFVVPGVAG